MAENGHLENLIVDLIRSLDREMQQGFTDLRERFDRQEARFTKHRGLLAGGARQLTRVIEWSEAADDQAAKRDVRIAELEKRVTELEKRLGS